MTQVTKTFQVDVYNDGTTRVISTDKRQMAHWYALDYFKDKAQKNSQGFYVANLSADYYFSAGFRKQNK